MPDSFTVALVAGEKGQILFPKLPIDPEVFFTTLPSEILVKIGAYPELLKARMQQNDSLWVEAQVFSVIVSAHGREEVTLAITFEGARPLLGAKFLEDLGLRINPDSSVLESTRHHGFAHNQEP